MEPDLRLQQKIRRFEDELGANPDSLAFARLADLHRKAGDPGRALEILGDGLDRHPDYASGHIVRGRCLRDLDELEDAREAFEQALELDGQNLVALRALAVLARERGNREEAVRRLEALLEVDPRNEPAREMLDEWTGEGAADEGRPGPRDGASGGTEADEDAGDGGEGSEPGGGAAAGSAEPPPRRFPSSADAPGPEDGAGVEAEPGPGTVSAGREQGAGREEDPEASWEEILAAGEPAGGEGNLPVAAGSEADVRDRRPGDEADVREGESGDEEGPEAEAASSPAFGSADADELRARIQELGRDVDGGEPGDGRDDDLATETLAGLYEAQGFHRQAVEMYEKLVERRPDDRELRRRLERAREALDSAEDEAEDEDAAAAPETAADERTVDAPVAPSPAGGSEEASGAGGGDPEPADTAREQLRALLEGEARPRDGAGREGRPR